MPVCVGDVAESFPPPHNGRLYPSSPFCRRDARPLGRSLQRPCPWSAALSAVSGFLGFKASPRSTGKFRVGVWTLSHLQLRGTALTILSLAPCKNSNCSCFSGSIAAEKYEIASKQPPSKPLTRNRRGPIFTVLQRLLRLPAAAGHLPSWQWAPDMRVWVYRCIGFRAGVWGFWGVVFKL